MPREIPPDEQGFQWYPFTYEEMMRDLPHQLDAWIRALRTKTWNRVAAKLSLKLEAAVKLADRNKLPADVEATLRAAIASREKELLAIKNWCRMRKEHLKALMLFGTERIRATAVSALLDKHYFGGGE